MLALRLRLACVGRLPLPEVRIVNPEMTARLDALAADLAAERSMSLEEAVVAVSAFSIEKKRYEAIRAKDGWHVVEWFKVNGQPDYRTVSGPFRLKSQATDAIPSSSREEHNA